MKNLKPNDRQRHLSPTRRPEPADGMRIIFLRPEHGPNVLKALPTEQKNGDLFLLLGDPEVREIAHCALVVVQGTQIGAGGIPMLGSNGYQVRTDATVDLLGFAIRALTLRVQTLEAIDAVGEEVGDPAGGANPIGEES